MTEKQGIHFSRSSSQSFHVVPQWFKNVAGVNQQAELLLSLADVRKKGETVTGEKGLFQLTRHRSINQGGGGFKNVQVIVNNRGDTNFVWERHGEPPSGVSKIQKTLAAIPY